jgi:hypothetical protein
MPNTIDIPTVELVSVIRSAPANGAPSSLDYYDSDLEKVTDLSSLALFINNTLLPIVNALSPLASSGLLGTSCYSDTANQDSLVYNNSTGQSLTITQSMRLLNGQLQIMQTVITNLSQQVTSLQTRLSSTSQDDLSLALQNITSVLATQSAEIQSLQLTVSTLNSTNFTTVIQETTGSISANSNATVSITWDSPFVDNTYMVSYALDDTSGYLSILSFAYVGTGTGINVLVKNSDTVNSHTGFVIAQGNN